MSRLGDRLVKPLSGSLAVRAIAKELIDGPVHNAALLAESFADMSRVNRFFGGIAPVRDAVLATQATTVLDIGCGYGDLSRAIVVAARKQSRDLRVTCLDTSTAVLGIAANQSVDFPELVFVPGDGASLPFADGQFDAAICTLTLHHCDPPQAINLLREMQRVARYPLVGDLRRCRAGLVGALAFSRFLSRNALTRHDAPLSIRRAYTPSEMLALAQQAGWSQPQVAKTPYFRMLLRNVQ